MKKPYVLDLDGLDGISELQTQASAQVNVDAETASTHVEPDNLATNNDASKVLDKKAKSRLLKVAFLAIGVIGCLSYITLHDDQDSQPLSTQVASKVDRLDNPNEVGGKPNEKQYSVSELKPFKAERIIPDEKNWVNKIDEKSAVNAGLEPNLTVAAVEPVEKLRALNTGNISIAGNEKVTAQNKLNSKPRVESRSVDVNQDKIVGPPISVVAIKDRIGEIDENPSINTGLKPNPPIAAAEPVQKPKALNAENTRLAATKKISAQSEINNDPRVESRSAQIKQDIIDRQRADTRVNELADQVVKKPSVNTGLKPTPSVAPIKLKSIEKQNTLNTEHTSLVANEKVEVQNSIGSKPKIKSLSFQSSKNSSSTFGSETKTATKTDVIRTTTETAGKATTDFVLPFDFNEMTVANLSNAKLIALNDFAERCPDIIRVVGHTCNLGPLLSNQAVAQIRAEWVKGLLVERGLSAERIEVASEGQTKPVASNNAYAGRLLNRRVVVSCLSRTDKL